MLFSYIFFFEEHKVKISWTTRWTNCEETGFFNDILPECTFSLKKIKHFVLNTCIWNNRLKSSSSIQRALLYNYSLSKGKFNFSSGQYPLAEFDSTWNKFEDRARFFEDLFFREIFSPRGKKYSTPLFQTRKFCLRNFYRVIAR